MEKLEYPFLDCNQIDYEFPSKQSEKYCTEAPLKPTILTMKPLVKKYLCAYQFLQDFYHFKKSENQSFSYAMWATQLGIRNKAYLRLMVLGERPISPDIATAMIGNLGLHDDDAEYFKVLIAYSQAKNTHEKDILGSRLVNLVRNDFQQETLSVTAEFLSHPLLPKLHSLLSFKDIKKDPSTLAGHLNVSVTEIENGLLRLRQLDLLKDEETGVTITTPNFKVSDKFKDQGLKSFYENLFEGAKKAISLPQESRRFRSLFFAMNEEEIQEFNKRLDDFAKEILSRHDFSELGDRRLYQFHYNFYPLSEKQTVDTDLRQKNESLIEDNQ